MTVENTQIQMRKGILEFCILHIISRGEVYSKDIIKEVREASIDIKEGTLYPLLNRFKTSELVSYSWKESNSGPPQKHYQLTQKGREFLERLNKTWADLVDTTNRIITKNSVATFHKLDLEAIKIKNKA